MLRCTAVLAALALTAVAAPAHATTYFVAPDGSDAAAGASQSAAWRSVARVNAQELAPGDTVLFQGGATFSGLLRPATSGSAAAPITFSSYGGSRANVSGGISLASRRWLVFKSLAVDTGAWQTAGSTRGITTSSSGSGVQDVVVRDCVFQNVALGLMLSNSLDARWSVQDSTIRWTRDSGILIYDPDTADEVGASALTFERNEILDTGLDASLDYKKHAVYDIGVDSVWRDNVIRRFSEGGFSLRAHGNVLEHNTISDGPYAIYYSAYDSTPGTTQVVYNKISDVTESALTIDVAGRVANNESYLVAGNTMRLAGSASGIRLVGTTGSVAIANNVVVAGTGPAFRADVVPAGGLTERNDVWWSTAGRVTLGFAGRTYTDLAAFRATTGRGAGSVIANPELDAGLAPSAASPVVDAGTTAVAGRDFVRDCASGAWHYCGDAPDAGAVETSAAPAAPPAPTPPPAPAPAGDTTKPQLTVTSPSNGQTIPLTFAIKATASDAGGIKNVTFWFDGNPPCVDTAAPYVSCAITTTRGGHSIRVRATDAAGNYTEQTLKIWADPTARALAAATPRKVAAKSKHAKVARRHVRARTR